MTGLVTADYIGWHHNMGAGSWILMVLFWGLVAAGIVWLVFTATRPRRATSTGPLEILDHRLAAGEISVEEYRERRAELIGGTYAAKPEGSSSA